MINSLNSYAAQSSPLSKEEVWVCKSSPFNMACFLRLLLSIIVQASHFFHIFAKRDQKENIFYTVREQTFCPSRAKILIDHFDFWKYFKPLTLYVAFYLNLSIAQHFIQLNSIGASY